MGDLYLHETKLREMLAEHQHLTRKAQEETTTLERVQGEVETLTKAQVLVQEVASKVQASAHEQIAGVVSRCLEAVFGEEAYTFKIHFDSKRGKTEARLVFVRDGLEVDPCDASGGGAVDVAALALRLACMVLARPRRRRLLVVDEPLKHLNGREYQERVGTLIETLARETGVQFIIVSDDDWLKVGHVVEL